MTFHRLFVAIIGIALCVVSSISTFAQSTGAWTVTSPSNDISLVSVEQVAPDVYEVVLKNNTETPILYLEAITRDGNFARVNGFVVGQEIEAGSTTQLSIQTDSGSTKQGPFAIRVLAIIFADGRDEGDAGRLVRAHDELLAEALEMRRGADILASNKDLEAPDKIDVLTKTIGIRSPSSGAEAASMIKGHSLHGISDEYISRRLMASSEGLRVGVHLANQVLLKDLKMSLKGNSVGTLTSSAFTAKVQRGETISTTDLLEKYSSVTNFQLQCLAKFQERHHVQ
jgi:hypothetical protein